MVKAWFLAKKIAVLKINITELTGIAQMVYVATVISERTFQFELKALQFITLHTEKVESRSYFAATISNSINMPGITSSLIKLSIEAGLASPKNSLRIAR